jgi:hypothetical protein
MPLRRVIIAAAPLAALVLSAVLACSAGPAYGASPTVIDPGHLAGWTMTTNRQVAPPYDSGNLNSRSTASYEFTNGPATPPAGKGSLLMSAGSESNSRVAANPPGLTGRTFGAAAELRYATYLENESTTGHTAPINLKLAGTSAKLGFLTAVFEPTRQSTAPKTKAWQNWDASAGTWWTSKVTSGACAQADPCSWRKFVGKIGKGTTISTAYFELGDSGDQFSGVKCALDDVTINGVSYDFEQSAPAEPTARAAQSVVGSGGQVTVHGTGFLAHERVSATLHSHAVYVGTGTADGSGAVTVTFTVPAGTQPGQHVILLTGLTSGRTATVPLTVVGGPATGFGGMAPFVATHQPGALAG